MCEFCKEQFPIEMRYGKFAIRKVSNKHVIACQINKCPPFAACCSKNIRVEMLMEITYCPICGRKLLV